MHYVYVLRNKNGKLYIGYTRDLTERLKKNNEKGSRFTSKLGPWTLIFYEAYLSRIDAVRREQYLKTSKGWTALKTMLQDTLS